MTRAERRYRRAAIVAGALLVLLAAFTWLKSNPFSAGYHLRAVLGSVNQLKQGAEVRVAGVRVGTVKGIDGGPRGTAVIDMRIEDRGRPVRADATVAVKPRLVLEGNAYVELRPGSPAAEELGSGSTLPRAQTSVSPQLDQFLSVFDTPTRDSLHSAVAELGAGLGPGPDGHTGYGGLRAAVRELDGALDSVRLSADAFGGTRPGDLAEGLHQVGAVTGQLSADRAALSDWVTNFRRVTGALAAQDAALADSVTGFDALVRTAPPSLTALTGALPALTGFGRALRPTLEAAPSALTATSALLDQLGGLASEPELGRLTDDLAPVTRELPRLQRRATVLFHQVDPVAECISSHLVPVSDMTVPDGPLSTKDPVWQDALHSLAGFSSFSSAVDANGGTVRLGITGGDQVVGGVLPGVGDVAGYLPSEPLGVRPTWLGYGVEPPYRPDQRCADQPLPDLSERDGEVPAWMRAALRRSR